MYIYDREFVLISRHISARVEIRIAVNFSVVTLISEKSQETASLTHNAIYSSSEKMNFNILTFLLLLLLLLLSIYLLIYLLLGGCG
jgi:hypothetical protein